MELSGWVKFDYELELGSSISNSNSCRGGKQGRGKGRLVSAKYQWEEEGEGDMVAGRGR